MRALILIIVAVMPAWASRITVAASSAANYLFTNPFSSQQPPPYPDPVTPGIYDDQIALFPGPFGAGVAFSVSDATTGDIFFAGRSSATSGYGALVDGQFWYFVIAELPNIQAEQYRFRIENHSASAVQLELSDYLFGANPVDPPDSPAPEPPAWILAAFGLMLLWNRYYLHRPSFFSSSARRRI